jgi:hypothetical protein
VALMAPLKLGAGLLSFLFLAVFPASNNYQLKSYGVNSGGSNNTSGATYKAQVGTGEVNGNVSGGSTYQAKSGSIEAQQANVPGAPTISNGGGTYSNKLNFVISTAGNPSDATFSVAVSTASNFSTTNYVQADGTLGSNQVYQTYSQWGSGSGTLAIGLTPSTTYYFKVAAMHGQFTNTAFGPSASGATVNNTPAISFSVSPSTVNMGNLTSGSVITSPSDLTFNFSTNASSGGTVYVTGSNTGLTSVAASKTIDVSPPSGNLSSLGEGFGLQGLTAGSPLAIQSPYNGSSNTVGAIYTTFQPLFSSTSSVSSATATATLKAKSSTTTPAANDYTVTLTFVAAASY